MINIIRALGVISRLVYLKRLDIFVEAWYNLEKCKGDDSVLAGQPVVINLSGDWTSATVDVLLLIVTVLSVACAFFAYGHQKARNKKDTACNLAKHYADSIINKYADIVNVFVETGISSEIKDLVNIADLKYFNADELKTLTKDNAQRAKALFEKTKSIDPEVILAVRMNNVCSPMERDGMFQYYVVHDEEGNRSVRNGRYLQLEFSEEIANLLNELEWFAMNCRYRLADEKLLYQSLHQTFLSTVWLLYFHISAQNTNNEDKLYTNVIWLFGEWRDRLLKITKKAEKKKSKYIEKANAVKTEIYTGRPL